MRTIVSLLFGIGLLPLVAAAAEAPTALDAGMVNPGFHEKPAWFKESFLDMREDVAEAADAGKRVMLYFYQDGCPYCARLLGVNFTDQRVVDLTRKHFDTIAINMWGDREVTGLQGEAITEKKFAAGLKVQFTPTLLFLDEQGKVVLRLNGYFPPHKFLTALTYVAEKHETRQPFPAYLAANTAAASSGKLHKLGAAIEKPLKLADHQKASGRPLVVLFEQEDCQACDELHGDILKRQEIGSSLTNLDVAQIDVWSNDPVQTPGGDTLPAKDWANKINVQYTPSLVFFDATGKEVMRIEAYLKSFHIHGVLDYVATGAYLRQPSFQRFLAARADALEARGFHVDLMN